MGITDLFRPKWKHSDAEVRAGAVRQLTAEEHRALALVARDDEDPAVRRIAIKKLTEIDLLEEIAATDPDESLRQLAGERFSQLLLRTATGDDPEQSASSLAKLTDPKAIAEVVKNAALAEIQRQALERLDDDKALADVARSSREPQLRTAALERISDEAVLRAVAIDGRRRDIGLGALERIEDRAALDEIARKAKSKAVRSQARKRLRAASKGAESDSAKRDAQLRERAVALCKQVEATTPPPDGDWEAAAERIARARETWSGVRDQLDDERLRARFDRAVVRFESFRERYLELLARREREQREQQEQQASAPPAQERTQAAEPEAASEAAEPPAESERGEQGAAGRAERERAELEALCERAEQAVGARSLEQAERRWKRIERDMRRLTRALARDDELQQRFAAAGEQLAERKKAAEVERRERIDSEQRRLEKLCGRLEGLATTSSIRDADKALAEAQRAFKSASELPSDVRSQLSQRYEAARVALFNRAQELRQAEEWKRWSNVGRKEELCREAEKLREVDEAAEVAKRLRQLQSQWKRFGPVSRDRADDLWIRFKTACDIAYARCKSYFDEREGERNENLAAKQALCEKVEALADSTDWRETAEKIKGLQAEWKAIGPVPKEQSDEVWKRFRAACDAFFDRRKQHYAEQDREREGNLAAKQALCEKVEALADSTDWRETAEEIKRIQAEWKAIGPVPRRRSQALWKRFRAACDRFFDRRDAELAGELKENLARAESLCAELEALAGRPAGQADSEQPTGEQPTGEQPTGEQPTGEQPTDQPPTDEQLARRVSEARAAWRELGRLPREARRTIEQRFRDAVAGVVAARPAAFAKTELDPEPNRQRKQRLCAGLEQLLERARELEPARDDAAADADSASTDHGGVSLDPEQMAAQLREALAANALGTQKAPAFDWGAALRELRELRSAWRRTGPVVPPERDRELQQRFDAAADELYALAPEAKKAKRAKRTGRGRKPRDRRTGGKRPGEPAAPSDQSRDSD